MIYKNNYQRIIVILIMLVFVTVSFQSCNLEGFDYKELNEQKEKIIDENKGIEKSTRELLIENVKKPYISESGDSLTFVFEKALNKGWLVLTKAIDYKQIIVFDLVDNVITPTEQEFTIELEDDRFILGYDGKDYIYFLKH